MSFGDALGAALGVDLGLSAPNRQDGLAVVLDPDTIEPRPEGAERNIGSADLDLSLRGSQYEILAEVNFLKPGAFLVQNVSKA